jgi:hypothetical protein
MHNLRNLALTSLLISCLVLTPAIKAGFSSDYRVRIAAMSTSFLLGGGLVNALAKPTKETSFKTVARTIRENQDDLTANKSHANTSENIKDLLTVGSKVASITLVAFLFTRQ